jgi:hypothetical protein
MALEISPTSGLQSNFPVESSSNQPQVSKPRRYVSVEQNAFRAEYDRLESSETNWHRTRGRPRLGTKSFIVELSQNLGICTRTAANLIARHKRMFAAKGGAK